MAPRRKIKNIFFEEFNSDVKLLIPSNYEDEILTHYFELGYDEQDMKCENVADFLISLRVPEILIAKYREFDTGDNYPAKFQDLTIASLEEEQVVDFDKLVFLTYKFILLRDNYEYIEQYWKLFTSYIDRNQSKSKTQDKNDMDNSLYGQLQRSKTSDRNSSTSIYDKKITYPDLKLVVTSLKLDDKINDGLMIDMIANGSDSARPFVNFFDFLVLLGKMGELNMD